MNAFVQALDIYSVANTYPREGRVLARMTQEAAVRYTMNTNKTELLVLLAFANALAYLDDETYRSILAA